MLSSFISRQTVNKSKPSGALFDVHGRTNVAGAGCTGATLGDFFLKKFCTWMYLCCDRMDAKDAYRT